MGADIGAVNATVPASNDRKAARPQLHLHLLLPFFHSQPSTIEFSETSPIQAISRRSYPRRRLISGPSTPQSLPQMIEKPRDLTSTSPLLFSFLLDTPHHRLFSNRTDSSDFKEELPQTKMRPI